eukprot:PITA_19093
MHCLYEIATSKGWSTFHEEIKQAAEQDPKYQQKKEQVQEVTSHIRQQGYELKATECQQVKVEHQHPAGLLEPLPIPEWKWEVITMDFITGLPKSKKGNDSIMVVVDKLSKSAHFIPVQSTYRAAQIANIFRLHGLPKTIISDRDVKFTLDFWKTLFEGLGTQLNFSTANHPQTDGQTERMSTFEVLYGRKCRTPSSWGGTEDKLVLGPEMLKEMEQMVKKVRANLKVAQDREKRYADRKRSLKEFQVGEHVYVRIRAKKSTLQWSGFAKLAPHFYGPFQILARIRLVAYQLALPSHIRVHNVFHVSVLKKYIYDPKHIISWQDIRVEPEGEFLVEPVSILDRRRVVLRKRAITQVKLQWQHFGPDEATWEDEQNMKEVYPELFLGEQHRDDVDFQEGEM